MRVGLDFAAETFAQIVPDQVDNRGIIRDIVARSRNCIIYYMHSHESQVWPRIAVISSDNIRSISSSCFLQRSYNQ